MNIQPNFNKKEFIINECMLFSVKAGLQTRNKNFPIYNNHPLTLSNNKDLKYQQDNTSNLKWFIFDFLKQYLSEIKENGSIESVHLLKIQDLAENITKQFKPILHQGRFRIGISQKIINLFLKYMWTMGEINEPIHCPIDGIVKKLIHEKLGRIQLTDWTQLDSMEEYMNYISAIKAISKDQNQTIAQWELTNWSRRK